jgi:hypothetical protein
VVILQPSAGSRQRFSAISGLFGAILLHQRNRKIGEIKIIVINELACFLRKLSNFATAGGRISSIPGAKP